jgi:hypothetical protein
MKYTGFSILTVLYSIILTLQYKFISRNKKDFTFDAQDIKINEQVKYNKQNFDKIKQIFTDTINKRINLLESGKLNYNEWIEYNKKNLLIDIENHKYYIFVFDQLDKDEQIITRVHANKDFINLSWVDVLKSISEDLLFTKYQTDDKLINNMFKLSKNGTNFLEYYWHDPILNSPIKKLSFFNNYHDKKTDTKGVIGIGMDVEDLNITSTYKYINVIHYIYLFICSFLTYFISLLILTTSQHEPTLFTYGKSILFILSTNFYIYKFLNVTELTSTTNSELTKVKSIRDSLLSVSFLTGVNTFILSNFSTFKKFQSLYVQNAILFGSGIFLLLISTIKYTNYNNINDLITDRISLQLTFNFCIIINMLILFNYTSYYLINKTALYKKL